MPSAGAAISADAPPEISTSSSSSAATESATASALRPAASLAAVGSGWPPTIGNCGRLRADHQPCAVARSKPPRRGRGHRGGGLSRSDDANAPGTAEAVASVLRGVQRRSMKRAVRGGFTVRRERVID
jgi:hypothetical protein